jgi:hypothetical protein
MDDYLSSQVRCQILLLWPAGDLQMRAILEDGRPFDASMKEMRPCKVAQRWLADSESINSNSVRNDWLSMPWPPKHNASSKRHGNHQNHEQCGGLNPRNRRNAEGHHES